MARRPQGWILKIDKRTGIYVVRFTHDGKRYLRSTSERDFGRAKAAAARIYNEVTGGGRQHDDVTVITAAPAAQPLAFSEAIALDERAADWLAHVEPALDETTHRSYTLYVRALWIPFFGVHATFTDAKVAEYVRKRLREVRRVTLLKELSALRGFLNWCKAAGLIARVPAVISPPRTVPGVASKKVGVKIRVDITEVEAEAILAALPERSEYGLRPRAYFTFMWESALRRETINSMRTPDDYTRGSTTARIRDEADKVRFGRELPLSKRAREALDSVCKDKGPIFGSASYRHLLEKAAKAAGLNDHRARHLSYHDWRHAALTHMASTTTDLTGLAYLAGHRDVATTARYVHSHRSAAERVIAAREKGRER